VSVQPRPGHSITRNDERRITAFDGLAALSSNTAFATLGARKMSTAARKRNAPSLADVCRAQAARTQRQNEQLTAILGGTDLDALRAFVAGAFEGTTPRVNVGAASSPDVAAQAIVAAINAALDTPLSYPQECRVVMQVMLAWHARAEERRAGLADTCARLHDPMFAMGGR
jgi:hypothetical protein